MFLYELGVEEPFRRRGIGRTLVAALRELAIARGCYGMFVLTDDDNLGARATCGAAGGSSASPQLMLSWEFGPHP
jgi:ribosomal protein S18 acetylase RimI-like enzyme